MISFTGAPAVVYSFLINEFVCSFSERPVIALYNAMLWTEWK